MNRHGYATRIGLHAVLIPLALLWLMPLWLLPQEPLWMKSSVEFGIGEDLTFSGRFDRPGPRPDRKPRAAYATHLRRQSP